MSRLLILFAAAVGVFLTTTRHANAQMRLDDIESVKLVVTARQAPQIRTSIRLVPEVDPTLHVDGYSLLMQTILETQHNLHRIREVTPDEDSLLTLELEDPQLTTAFARLSGDFSKFTLLASIDQCNWPYGVSGESLLTTLATDLSESSRVVKIVLSLLIRREIARGDFEQAHRYIAAQLGCARLMAKGPFAIHQLQANFIGLKSLDRIEELIEQRNGPNYYWALQLLPSKIGDTSSTALIESRIIFNEITSLQSPLPPVGDPQWSIAAQELLQLLGYLHSDALQKLKDDGNLEESDRIKLKALEIINRDLPRLLDSTLDMDQMSDEEKFCRWFMLQYALATKEGELAYTLSPMLALKRFEELSTEEAALVEEVGLGDVRPFSQTLTSPAYYLFELRFQRRIRQLQVIEAIRDHVAYEKELPQSLDQLRLLAPNDPLTGRPFKYERTETGVRVSAEVAEGIDPALQRLRTIELEFIAD